jgi:hypothetical protein
LLAAGLGIQAYQLRSIEQTVDDWLSRITRCMDGILRISGSEVSVIGSRVLEQEQRVSAQLGRLAGLERECRKDNAEIHEAFGGLSKLTQLVGEHLERSKFVREKLRMLTFNSIVEASHLGSEADAILEISQSIKRVSQSGGELTDRSAQAMEKILALVTQSEAGMRAFSAEGESGLQAAAGETEAALDNMRAVAALVADKALEVEEATNQLQIQIAAVGQVRDRLVASFATIRNIPCDLEETRRRVLVDYPAAGSGFDAVEAERIFSESYTTETERKVLRAALRGEPLPGLCQDMGGNGVDLF